MIDFETCAEIIKNKDTVYVLFNSQINGDWRTQYPVEGHIIKQTVDTVMFVVPDIGSIEINREHCFKNKRTVFDCLMMSMRENLFAHMERTTDE